MTLPDFGIPATGQCDTGAEGIRAVAPLGQPQRLESKPVSYNDLVRRARQIPRIATNPGTYYAVGYGEGVLQQIAEVSGQNQD